MGIFSKIASAIFGKTAEAAPVSTTTPGSTTTTSAAPTQSVSGNQMTQAQVEALIEKIANGQRERLDWKHSIVDLMKLLKLDSSLAAREKLANELGYTGAKDGSAEMNIWLHKQVMLKLAQSGGKVPENLQH